MVRPVRARIVLQCLAEDDAFALNSAFVPDSAFAPTCTPRPTDSTGAGNRAAPGFTTMVRSGERLRFPGCLVQEPTPPHVRMTCKPASPKKEACRCRTALESLGALRQPKPDGLLVVSNIRREPRA